MKRKGYLISQIADPDNLRLAFLKARKGKMTRASVRRFQDNLHVELRALRNSILTGNPVVGDYHFFSIRDPKPRLICAAHFRERVLHHAIMNVCEPVLDRALIFHTYACRKDKGTFAALDQAQSNSRRYQYYCQFDIRKYFDSINHEICLSALERKIKDQETLKLFETILNSYSVSPGVGLPIGNLISQHLANYYLAPLDRKLSEHKESAYLRYMDDFVLWSDDKTCLKTQAKEVGSYLSEELELELKKAPELNRTSRGISFLGHRVFPGTLRLSKRSKDRFVRKWKKLEREYETGLISETELCRRTESLLGFVMHADTLTLRRKVFYNHNQGVSV